jgi:hypothetical protein
MTPEEIAAETARKAAEDAAVRAAAATATKAAQDAAAAANKATADAAAAAEATRKAAADAAARKAADADEADDANFQSLPKWAQEEIKSNRAAKAREKAAREAAEAEGAKKLGEIEAATTTERNARLALEARLVAREQDDAIRSAYPKADALSDPSVVAHVRSSYAEYAKTAGADAKPIEAWLVADAPKSPLLRLALGSTGTGGGAGAGRRAPDVQRGAGGGDGAPAGKLSPEQIRDAGRNPRAWRAGEGERVRKQLEEEYGSIGSGRPKAKA